MKLVNKDPLFPKLFGAGLPQVAATLQNLIERLYTYLNEYSFRLNRVYPKDGSEPAEILTLNASAVSAPAATSGQSVLYISSTASIAGEELKLQSDVDLYTVAMFPSGGYWEDYTQSISAGKAVGANAPTWSSVNSGIFSYAFDDSTMNEVWITTHIRHDIKQNTALYPHIHWTPGNSTNTGVVRWGFEYTAAKGHGQEAFTSTTTNYIHSTSSGTAHMHYIAEVTAGAVIPTTNIEVDSLVLFRVFRDAANAADTFVGDAFGLEFDIHYLKQRLGTKNKEPGFYT